MSSDFEERKICIAKRITNVSMVEILNWYSLAIYVYRYESHRSKHLYSNQINVIKKANCTERITVEQLGGLRAIFG